jgi:hypothetical protein
VATPSVSYEPRHPADGVLFRIVRDHFETLRAEAARRHDGSGLPRFVEQEFREFLTCGQLANGFARFRCAGCGLDRLVAFSCKGRGFCPSCGGRRMAERAAHLVDDVLPFVAVRQWVLTFPHRVRYVLAWDHGLCRSVVAMFLRTVLGHLCTRARRRGVADGRGGAVAIVQRFGAALNLNVHIHALVLDGVFAPNGLGGVTWHRAVPLTGDDVGTVLAIVERRVRRLLSRRGLVDADQATDGWAEEAPVLAGIAAASVQSLTALGPRAGARVRRCGDDVGERGQAVSVPPLGRCHARANGFDLHAAVVVPAGDRERLERICHYALRPPVAQDRVSLTHDGQVRLALRRRWADGTTHLLFDPIAFLERLAALTPRPRINLILYHGVLAPLLYHGVLAPRAAWRALVVPRRAASDRPDEPAARTGGEPRGATERDRHSAGNHQWASLMRRVFGFDVLACPRCGGRLRLVALIEQAAVIGRILGHLGLPTVVPAHAPPRAPPLPFGDSAK